MSEIIKEENEHKDVAHIAVILEYFLEKQQNLLKISQITAQSHKDYAWERISKRYKNADKNDFSELWNSLEDFASEEHSEANKDSTQRVVAALGRIQPTRDYLNLITGVGKTDLSEPRLKETALTFLIGDFEVVVTSLLRIIYDKFPSVLESKEEDDENKYTRKDILKLKSLNSFRESLIEKDILSLMYKPFPVFLEKGFQKIHFFDPVGGKLDICQKDSVVEIFQRRNIIMHNGGEVSQKYLDNLQDSKLSLPEIGTILSVDDNYLAYAFDKITLITIYLCSLMIHKIYGTNEMVKDDWASHILSISFEFLLDERYHLVKDLCFTPFIQKIQDTYVRNCFFVNEMLAMQALGKQEEVNSRVAAWSKKADEENPIFGLARLILTNKLVEALAVAQTLKSENKISEASWLTWPLYKTLREYDPR